MSRVGLLDERFDGFGSVDIDGDGKGLAVGEELGVQTGFVVLDPSPLALRASIRSSR